MGSTSIATTLSARSSSDSVSAPLPGPISTAKSVRSPHAAAAIRSSTDLRLRKCCPSLRPTVRRSASDVDAAGDQRYSNLTDPGHAETPGGDEPGEYENVLQPPQFSVGQLPAYHLVIHKAVSIQVHVHDHIGAGNSDVKRAHDGSFGGKPDRNVETGIRAQRISRRQPDAEKTQGREDPAREWQSQRTHQIISPQAKAVG